MKLVYLLSFLFPFLIFSQSQTIIRDNIQYEIIGDYKLKLIAYSYGGHVSIPNTITLENKLYTVDEIATSAFQNNHELKSVVLPNSLRKIGYSAFEGCTGLTAIQLPNALLEIQSGAFYGCTYLDSIHIPASLEILDETAFGNCEGLRKIQVADENPFWSTYDGALYDKLQKRLILCPSGKTTIDFPTSLESIARNAFHNCARLREIQLPVGITVIATGQFQNCFDLRKLIVSQTVQQISMAAFMGCPNLAEIVVDSANTFYTSERGVLYNDDMTHLIKCPPARAFIEIPQSVTRLNPKAFAHCDELSTIIIPYTVITIGESCFFECTSLTSVTFESPQPPLVADCAFCESSNSLTFYLPKGSLATYRNQGGSYLNTLKWEELPETTNVKPNTEEKGIIIH